MSWINEISNLNDILMEFLQNLGYLAPLISCFLIVLEGLLAFLPLFVFFTVNIITLGPLLGGIISWIFTVLGSFLAFYLCRRGFSKGFQKGVYKRKKVHTFMKAVDKLKFKQLVLIIAIPFAPSFFINLGAGLSHIALKKYLYALMIGKTIVVIFWGFLGYNLVECLTNPIALVRVGILLVGAYIVAQVVNNKLDIDERFN